MIKSIQVLLSIVAHFDYKIWQMNVKNAFLNGNLEKDIYMIQQYNFVPKGEEHMVCKLHGPFMDLNKPPKFETFVLIRRSNLLILNKIQMNHVYIISASEAW